jgi:hypothetical protein
VLAAHRGELLGLSGVVGVGEGELDGEPCVVVLVEPPRPELPAELEGYPVSVIESGPVTALS